MAAPKLTPEQRLTLLTWLAAGYSTELIRHRLRKRQWPALTRQTLDAYRKRHGARIAALQAERHAAALTAGLALREERIARLAAHADRLEAIKWVADKKTGRLWNEKAWRETLGDIAAEMGERTQHLDVTTRGQALLQPVIREVVIELPVVDADAPDEADESVDEGR